MLRPTTLLPALVAAVATLAAVSPATAADDALAHPAGAVAHATGVVTATTTRAVAAHTSASPELHAAAARGLGAATPRARNPRSGSLPARRPAADKTPLSVTIDSLNPSYVPKRGPIRVTGSVTNQDNAPWSTVYLFAFMGDTPIRTTAELAEASKTDPTTEVGGRITAPGSYDTVGRIDPGETVQFSLEVSRSQLGVTEPGVYWFGVHALGTGPEGRIEGADGRARTFLPLVPRDASPVDTALVVPLRRTVSYAPDGSIDDVEGWNTSLSPGGRLRSLVDFGAAAGTRPLTWLVDPALTDIVHNLTVGNPSRRIAPDPTGSSGQPTESPSPSDGSSGDGGGQQGDPALAAVANSGNAWLDRLHEALLGGEILALPYGDLDAAAAAQHDPKLYRKARKRSGDALEPWGLPMAPALSSPGGYVPGATLRTTPHGTTVLATDRMFGSDPPAVARTAGVRMVTTSSAAATGGPGPDDPLAPVALRQRILAEAALRLLAPGHRPLVVVLPSYWTPSSSYGFFEGLDVDWLHLTTVGDIATRKPRAMRASELDYPPRLERSELDPANFASAQALIRAGHTLEDVLSDNDSVSTTVSDQAMTATSYGHRANPDAGRADTDRSRTWIEQELGSIRIDAPPAVTLSSNRGRFAATISNGLDQPVTVSIQALTDEPMDITGPTAVDIGAGGRRTVLLNAVTHTLGVHRVTLVVTDSDGVPLGSSDQLPIRSAQVSQVIWLIIGTGIALLFGAIAVRLVRRVRAARRGARP